MVLARTMRLYLYVLQGFPGLIFSRRDRATEWASRVTGVLAKQLAVGRQSPPSLSGE